MIHKQKLYPGYLKKVTPPEKSKYMDEYKYDYYNFLMSCLCTYVYFHLIYGYYQR